MTIDKQRNTTMEHYTRGITLVVALLCMMPVSVLAQGYAYPADNDADYYDRQYHTPVTPVQTEYNQPTRYPSDNDADYYEYYYGTSGTAEQYQDDNAYYGGAYQQNPYYPPTQYQNPYQGQQNYHQGYGQGYPQDNDAAYYANPAYAPSASTSVNQWDD